MQHSNDPSSPSPGSLIATGIPDTLLDGWVKEAPGALVTINVSRARAGLLLRLVSGFARVNQDEGRVFGDLADELRDQVIDAIREDA